MKGSFAFAVTLLVIVPRLFAQSDTASKHPFGVDDWAALRSATAIAVAADAGTILYRVDFGGAKARPTMTFARCFQQKE